MTQLNNEVPLSAEPDTTARDDLAFLAGGGEMGARIRAYDWWSSPLGDPGSWPQSLRTAVSIMLNSAHPIFVAWGPQLISLFNDAYAPVLGGKLADALGRPFSALWSEIWDDLRPLVERALAGEAVWLDDLKLVMERHGYPEETYFSFSYSPIRDETGRIIGMFCACMETTQKVMALRQRERAEQALRELNENLESMVAQRTRERDRLWRLSKDMMAVAGFDGSVLAVNPACSEISGYSEAELKRINFLQLVHPDDAAAHAAELARVQAGHTSVNFETRFLHKDGSYRWISWTSIPEAGLIHAIGRDVTQRKAAAEALRQAEEALRQSQKMEAVGQLTGGIAHDFNNLLQGITSALQLAERRLARGQSDVGRYIERAMAAANRAAALTHRLLAFARRQPLDPKPVDVNRLVNSMEELLRRTLGVSVALELLLADESLWPALCDPHQLEGALLNLAINARDAMPEGGKLSIATASEDIDAAFAARYSGMKPGQYVRVSVSDSGTGMRKEVIDRAFEPFFTTKPFGKGTGLGLSMIYGFVRQSGGYVHIDSQPGRGTTVTLYLPRSLDAALEVAERRRSLELAGAQDEQVVLVVEDEPDVRALVVEALRELDYRVLEAGDGATGLRILRSPARIDLLLTDFGLPGMNGRQMLEAAQGARPDLTVLFMSGYAADVHKGLLKPGVELISKPFAMDALAMRIRSLLEQH